MENDEAGICLCCVDKAGCKPARKAVSCRPPPTAACLSGQLSDKSAFEGQIPGKQPQDRNPKTITPKTRIMSSSIKTRTASGTPSQRIDDRRVTVVLGPTNTGKTHLALERMTGYGSGMIGFPLRLLARENYDRLVARLGHRRWG